MLNEAEEYVNPYNLLRSGSTPENEMLLTLAKKHFPFDTPNPGQLQAIVWVCSQFLKGEKHVVLQAPTGIGKSVIATTVDAVLKDLAKGFRTTIITATIGLQQQYIETDKRIYDLRGRTNYKCPFNKGPYNSGQCRTMRRNGGCVAKRECPYVIKRTKWCNEAELRSSNFSFQIEACDSLCMTEETKTQLMVIDECHEIDDAIVDHTSITIIPGQYRFTEELGFPQFYQGMVELHASLEAYSKQEYFDTPEQLSADCNVLSELSEDIQETLDNMISDKDSGLSDSKVERYGDMLELMQQVGDKLTLFGKASAGAKWIVNEYKNDSESQLAIVKPIFAWQVADYALFRKADIFLHMSATICGIDEYASTLGLSKFVYGELDNPIPLNNRKIYYIPKFKVNAGFKDFEKMGMFMGKIIERHAPSNGLIHCVSYALGNNIFQHLPKKGGAFIGRDRNEIVDEMSNHNSGRVCISPSIVKGYDFKGDMSRFQVIAKVPYGYLGDPLIKLNSEYRSGWYARKAILQIVQAAGRSVRGVDDHATTYITDSSFGRLLHDNREIFPDWFLESIVEVKM